MSFHEVQELLFEDAQDLERRGFGRNVEEMKEILVELQGSRFFAAGGDFDMDALAELQALAYQPRGLVREGLALGAKYLEGPRWCGV